MTTEICRLLFSFCVLGLCGFLYWCGFQSPETATELGMTNMASVIVGANLTYWLKPQSGKE